MSGLNMWIENTVQSLGNRDRRNIFLLGLAVPIIGYTTTKLIRSLVFPTSETPKIYPSPRKALQQLSQQDQNSLPYPSDALPGGRDVDTPYGNIRVYEWGPEDGRKVLCVHGISTPCIAFARLARLLVEQRGCRVMLFDLFGRGYSDAPDPAFHRQDMALWTSQILLVLSSSPLAWTGNDRFTMIGYSMGGGISAAFTSVFPDLVEALVLIAPGGLIRPHRISRSSRWLYGNLLPQSLVNYLVRGRLRSGNPEKLKPKASTVAPSEEVDAEVPDPGHPANARNSDSDIFPERPGMSVAMTVDWELDAHPGFLPSFISSIKYAPVTGNHASWAAIGRRCAARRASAQPEKLRGLDCNSVLIILGETDSVIVADELEPDATEALGEENVSVVRLEGGHDVPIVNSTGCAETIYKMWDRGHERQLSKRHDLFCSFIYEDIDNWITQWEIKDVDYPKNFKHLYHHMRGLYCMRLSANQSRACDVWRNCLTLAKVDQEQHQFYFYVQHDCEEAMADILDTNEIKGWQSIITLIVFVITNTIVLFPFHVPIYIPRGLVEGTLRSLRAVRVLRPRQHGRKTPESKALVRFNFPVNLVTAPLIADLFLLATTAIGREEVYDGTVGTDHIYPIEIMAFFITLAYIAISIDSSGLIRWLSYKVLQKGGKSGRLLFLYLYVFFFALATLIGNDPIVLSGTPFLSYMTRASKNIENPKAWIFTQFAVSNVASAILVSSNPTNLVLAGAFDIKFIEYTANIIVPVVVTAILLFPFLLFVLFRSGTLVPSSIEQHELPEAMKSKPPVSPNIPFAKGAAETHADEEQSQLLLLEEIMNPYLDKVSAVVGATVMAATLIIILALNASSSGSSPPPAYWITCPGAFVMFCWDLTWGWLHRHETRRVAQQGREEVELACVEKAETKDGIFEDPTNDSTNASPNAADGLSDSKEPSNNSAEPSDQTAFGAHVVSAPDEPPTAPTPTHERRSLVSLTRDAWTWSRETFPTATTVASLLPFKLVPFGLTMFVLVQALVTKGWVAVFAYGWEHWINATGTMGAIVGMGFLSVVLCNFAGTNIGTTILLCRVVQAWEEIHRRNGLPLPQRTFWATVYSMALGLNYGAFSTAFSASLAGLLWRDILARKGIFVRSRDFVIVNFPIIAVAMIVGCLVLVGEVWLVRNDQAYDLG